MADIDDLKRKRDQLTARIQAAEARLKVGQKKADDRVKVLVGAAILERVRRDQIQACDLLQMLDEFLVRPTERAAVLGDDGQGSDTLKRLIV